jgi:hypothetical protein
MEDISMNSYFEMVLSKTGETVRVYGISTENGKTLATIYRPSVAGLGHPANGWQTVKITALVPPDFWMNDSYCTKTKKNKIKSRLKLITAEWQCTDGTVFTHEHLEDAIQHEATLMGEELEGE